ncbi:uracil-DNA glycosylase [Bacillus carboniphilus]|uniref:Uracil-DNA glycosylase n=1 Tax=Bacillus carboniphilus TaxID=86663 RepID=A0ABP3GC00_9BACI
MKPQLGEKWTELLKEEWEKPYFKELIAFLDEEYKTETIYPKKEDVFRALQLTDYNDVKIVILGQDPYHGPNQAHGLSFSVNIGEKIPPSLRNIYKELQTDLGLKSPSHGCLVKWAKEGVLLLNTVLTVRDGCAHSHKGKGWEVFTDQIIQLLNKREKPVIFILWGKPAQAKRVQIDESRHVCLMSPHPSPLSASKGFVGSSPFSKANHILKKWNVTEVDWHIPDK